MSFEYFNNGLCRIIQTQNFGLLRTAAPYPMVTRCSFPGGKVAEA
jgi:hypothetical protein